MEDYIVEVMRDQQKYIRIRMIEIGVVAASMSLDALLYNDLQRYSIVKEKDIFEEHLVHFIDDSDIVFLVVDMSDDFVVKNILNIAKIITQKNKLFVSILTNIDSKEDSISYILKDLRAKSSILVVENQLAISFNSQCTIQQKFAKFISGLLNMIDVKIELLRALDDWFSSLIVMNRFFEQKCDLYLYLNYSVKDFKKIPDIGARLEGLSQIWIRYCADIMTNDAKIDSFNEFMIFIESAIDENALLQTIFKEDTSEVAALIGFAL